MQYRTKLVIVTAIQWTGENDEEVFVFTGVGAVREGGKSTPFLTIPTADKDMIAVPGDWIIRPADGPLERCWQVVFAATYEPYSEADRVREDGALHLEYAEYAKLSVEERAALFPPV